MAVTLGGTSPLFPLFTRLPTKVRSCPRTSGGERTTESAARFGATSAAGGLPAGGIVEALFYARRRRGTRSSALSTGGEVFANQRGLFSHCPRRPSWGILAFLRARRGGRRISS